MTVMIASTILEVLDEKIKQGDVFTAYDITIAARAKTSNNVRHSDVREIVNNEFLQGEMTDYTRDLCTLDLSGSPQAFVYFPMTASSYDHPLVNIDTTDDSIDSIVDDSTEDSTEDSTDGKEITVTAEGRVNVPKDVLSKISPTGGSYDILVSGTLTCVIPNKDGRVRINARKLGIIGDKVEITVDSSKNIIEVI